MKRKFGIFCDGEIIDICHEEEIGGRECVELAKNPTWEKSDFTDMLTGDNYIRTDRLAFLFDELCKRSGMRKKALAERCGKSAETFSRYCSGVTPVPELVWREVERIVRKMGN